MIKLPKHIAIVMDGNGRWAEKRNLPRNEGHIEGVEVAKNTVKLCSNKNISVLSLFAFSIENYKRPSDEVQKLMQIFLTSLSKETEELSKNNIVLKFIGDRSTFSKEFCESMEDAEKITENNTGLKVIVAFNYSGRWDIVQSVNKIISNLEKGITKLKHCNEKLLSKYMSTRNIPDPDLFIRTSGEERISNFYLWQLTYTELYFTKTLWPDFNEHEFEKALMFYSKKQRRFGLTKEQISSKHV
jgi:undecaprenyl diphosphate synthase